MDWNSAESQELRFARLLTVLVDDGPACVNDYGCGYGALLEYLAAMGRHGEYRGFDISHDMIETARTLHEGVARCCFTSDPGSLTPADYTVASGIFNVKLQHSIEAWREYVWHTLEVLDTLSRRGFAFNMLSTYSDPGKRRDDLFYEDPLPLFDLCKRRFSPQVALLHDYPLYEFTMIVRK